MLLITSDEVAPSAIGIKYSAELTLNVNCSPGYTSIGTPVTLNFSDIPSAITLNIPASVVKSNALPSTAPVTVVPSVST